MISVYDLSWQIRSLVAIAILLTAIVNSFNVVIALRARRTLCVILSSVLLGISYISGEIVIQAVGMHMAKVSINNTIVPVFMPAAFFFFITIILLILTIATFLHNVWYINSHLTNNSIKECADKMEVGICYFLDGGRIVFQNKEMNRLCHEIIGRTLLNGEELYEAVSDRIISLSDKSTRKFEHKLTTIGGLKMHELLAFDITEFVEKSNKLKKENEELIQFNEKLKAYNLSLDATVKEEEILQAKIDIHDEMNQLLLTTVAFSENRDLGRTNAVMQQWKKNTILLNLEKDNFDKKIQDINNLAKNLGIEIEFKGEAVDCLHDICKDIFCLAAREAIANAVKNAGASQMIISILNYSNNYKFIFENDGRLPQGNVVFTGGLANLERIVKDKGGSLKIEVGSRFRLIVILKKEITHGSEGIDC